MIEKWKNHPEVTALEVSNMGNIRTLLTRGRRGDPKKRTFYKVFKQYDISQGNRDRFIPYKIINTTVGSTRKRKVKKTLLDGTVKYYDCISPRSYYVHKMVLETWVGMRGEGEVARHLDGNHHNNKLSNLGWGTRWQNEFDKDFPHRPVGGPVVKLDWESVTDIRTSYAGGSITMQNLADTYVVSLSCISQIMNNRTWYDPNWVIPHFDCYNRLELGLKLKKEKNQNASGDQPE